MKDVPDNELVSAYLDGELNAQERAQVEQWLAANPAARQLVDDLRALSSRLRSLPKERLGEDLSERVLQVAQRRMLTQPGSTAKVAPAQSAQPVEPAPWRKLVRRLATPRTLLWPTIAASVALWLALYHPGEREKAARQAKPQVAMESPSRPKASAQDVQIRALPDANSSPASTDAFDKKAPTSKADEKTEAKPAEKMGFAKSAAKSEAKETKDGSSFQAGGVGPRSESAAAEAAPARHDPAEREVRKDAKVPANRKLAEPPTGPGVMSDKNKDAAPSSDTSTTATAGDRAKAPMPAAALAPQTPATVAAGPAPPASLAAKQGRASESLRKENLAKDESADHGQAKSYGSDAKPAETNAPGMAAAGGGTRKAKADAPAMAGKKMESQVAAPASGLAMKAYPSAKSGKGSAAADQEAVVWCNIRSQTISETSLDEMLSRRHIAVQERSVVSNWPEVVSQLDRFAVGQQDAKRSQESQAAPAFQAAQRGMRGGTQVLLQTEITPTELQAVLEELKSQGHAVQVIDQRGPVGQLAQQALRSQRADSPRRYASQQPSEDFDTTSRAAPAPTTPEPPAKVRSSGGAIQDDLSSTRIAQKQRPSKTSKVARSADQRQSTQADGLKVQPSDQTDAKEELPAGATQGVGIQVAASRQRVVFVMSLVASPAKRAANNLSESPREGRPAAETSPAQPAKSSKQ